MTTLPRLWETSGCRLNPSLPPVPPHLLAVRVLLIPPPTATAQISPTKSPPAAHRQLPATGLSIKAEMTSDMGGNWTLHFTACSSAWMEIPGLVLRERWLTDAGVQSLWTSVCPDLKHVDTEECSINPCSVTLLSSACR